MSNKRMLQICDIYASIYQFRSSHRAAETTKANQTATDDRCNTKQSKILPHVVYNLFSF